MPSGKEPEYDSGLEPERNSFSQRILASASTLANSTFSQPPTNRELPASGLFPENKAGPSSASVSSNEHTGHHYTVDSNANPSRPAPLESFRSDIHSSENQRNEQITQNAFDEFQASPRGLNAIVDPLPDPQSQRTQATEKGNEHHPWVQIGKDSGLSKSSFSIPYPSPPEDGAAVVDLLSDPSFMLDDHTDDDADVVQQDDERILDARSNNLESMKNLTEQVDLREELKREIHAGVTEPGNGPAVKRLRMLLGHMRPTSTG